MSKVVVTGANGFLGAWLCKHLLEQGLDVHALVRKNSDLTELQNIKVKLLYGDVLDSSSLNEAFKEADSVFHLAGLIAYKKADREKMNLVNVTGTQYVLKAAQECGVRRMLHLSSVVAVGAGFSATEVLDESSPFNLHRLNLGYFETKLQAEQLAFSFAKQTSLEVVCVNPSTIYGPSDAKKGSRKTQIKVARGEFPFYTNGGVSIIDINDAINGIYQGWKSGRSGERYILSGDNITIQQLFQYISHFAQVKPPKLLMPTPILKGLGFAGDLFRKVGFDSSLSLENASTATLYHWFNSNKAKTELRLTTRPAAQSIESSVKWMFDNGLLAK